MNLITSPPQIFSYKRMVLIFISLIGAFLVFGLSYLSIQANDAVESKPLIAQLAPSNTTLAGNYNGTLVITSPANIGVVDLAIQLTSSGDNAAGTVLDPNTTHFSGSPTINATITGYIDAITPTFTIQSETFVETISGQQVTRSFSIEGEIWNEGTILSGHYAETVIGYTQEPLQLSGHILLSKPSIGLAQEPSLFLSVQAGTTSLPLNGSTTITAKLLDSNLQPVTEITSIRFSSNLGSVTPAAVDTDSNGFATATFTAGETSGLAIITAQAGSASGSTSITVEGNPPPPGDNKIYLPLALR